MDLKGIVKGCKSSELESIKALYELYSDALMRQCMFYVKYQSKCVLLIIIS